MKMNDKKDQLTTIIKTADQALITIAKSILEDADIKYFIKNEGLQNLFGAGQIGTGYNTIVGVPEIQVSLSDADDAKKLIGHIEDDTLNDVDNSAHSSEEDYERDMVGAESTKKYSNLVIGILIGLTISGIAFFFYDRHQKNMSGDFRYDLNKDSKTDVIHTYENGKLTKVVSDRNFDGKMDEWNFYENDIPTRGESDDNFDGEIDTWYIYKYGLLNQVDIDLNSDENIDIVEFYKNGVLNRREWYNKDKVLTKKENFERGLKKNTYQDTNADGKFDYKSTYNLFEDLIETEKLN